MSLSLYSQPWTFKKEKDGIKIFIRESEGSNFKSFRGETIYHTTMDKLAKFIGNVDNVSWWDKNVKEIKVLHYEPEKLIRYYLVYDVPWPLSDRDLCVEAKITVDPLSGERVVSAKPLADVIPEKQGMVRIRNYSQKWVLRPISKDKVQAILEGSVDPGGIVPAWLYNMVIVETPFKVMNGLKQVVE